jgi:spermidine synthase
MLPLGCWLLRGEESSALVAVRKRLQWGLRCRRVVVGGGGSGETARRSGTAL